MKVDTRPAGLQALPSGLVIAVFVVSMAWLLIRPDPFSLRNDEGFNLMKAFLMARGEHLFVDIWSDQPPVFTWLLRGMFAAFGSTVSVGRLTTLLCAALMLVAIRDFLREGRDELRALLGVMMVLMTPGIFLWSGAVLIGLPAIALAITSIACLHRWHRGGGGAWIIASGVMLALSACTKFFTLVAVPGVLLGFLLLPMPPGWQRVPAILLWSGILLMGLLLILGVTGALFHLDQLFGNHLQARAVPSYATLSHTHWLAGQPRCWLLYGLALPALCSARLRKSPAVLHCGVWMVTALLVLHFHRPFWSHHALLPAIPAAVLAAVTLNTALRRWLTPQYCRWAAWGFTMTSLVAVPICVQRTAEDFADQQWKSGLVELIRQGSGPDTPMIADNPLFAFRAGVPVDPFLTVFSNKRQNSGLLDEALLGERLGIVQPVQALFSAQTLRNLPGLPHLLARDYRLLRQAGGLQLHERRARP